MLTNGKIAKKVEATLAKGIYVDKKFWLSETQRMLSTELDLEAKYDLVNYVEIGKLVFINSSLLRATYHTYV